MQVKGKNPHREMSWNNPAKPCVAGGCADWILKTHCLFCCLPSDEASFVTGCTFSVRSLPAYHTPFLMHVLIMNNQPLTYRRHCIISLTALMYTHCHCTHVLNLFLYSSLPDSSVQVLLLPQSWWKNLCTLKSKVGEMGRKVPFMSGRKSLEEIPQENQILKQGWLAYHLGPDHKYLPKLWTVSISCCFLKFPNERIFMVNKSRKDFQICVLAWNPGIATD